MSLLKQSVFILTTIQKNGFSNFYTACLRAKSLFIKIIAKSKIANPANDITPYLITGTNRYYRQRTVCCWLAIVLSQFS